MTLENDLLFGTFKEARQAVLNSEADVSQYDLQQLAIKAGLDETYAHLLVTAVMAVAKRKVVAEVKRQSENLIHWVERA